MLEGLSLLDEFRHVLNKSILNDYSTNSVKEAPSPEVESLVAQLRQRIQSEVERHTKVNNNNLPVKKKKSTKQESKAKHVKKSSKVHNRKHHTPALKPSKKTAASKTNGDTSTTTKSKKISEQQFRSVLERLSDVKKRHHEKINNIKSINELNELKHLKCKPTIDKKSKKMAAGVPNLVQRQQEILDIREKELKKERVQKSAKEMKGVTASPNIRTPCLCGQTTGGHSSSCSRFMSICASTNNSYKIQKQTHTMKRTLTDIFAFAEEKEMRNIERKKQSHDEKESESTFSPRLNKNSIKIYKEMMKTGKSSRKGRKSTLDEEGNSAFTFKPTLTEMTQKLSSQRNKEIKSSSNVFTRLQEHAKDNVESKLNLEVNLMEKCIRNVKGIGKSDIRVGGFQKKQCLSEESQSDVDDQANSKKVNLMPQARTYSTDFEFIKKNFGFSGNRF